MREDLNPRRTHRRINQDRNTKIANAQTALIEGRYIYIYISHYIIYIYHIYITFKNSIFLNIINIVHK